VEKIVSLTQAQIARIFEMWNADVGANPQNYSAYAGADTDHGRQAEHFVHLADQLEL